MPNFCAAPNCTRKSTQSDLAFFRFPRDPASLKAVHVLSLQFLMQSSSPPSL